MTASERLEKIIGTVLRLGVWTSSICLAAGLVLAVLGGFGATDLLLQAGIVILLATPVARVVVSIAEYASERDWLFAALTMVVLIEVTAAAIAALAFNRRL